MPAETVPMYIDQGEDWTTQIIFTDPTGEPYQVIHPCRMEIKAKTGETLVTLDTVHPDDFIEGGPPPEIALSEEIGLIQIHIPREQTKTFPPDVYRYDLFVSTTDGGEYADEQVTRLLKGSVTVDKSVTTL